MDLLFTILLILNDEALGRIFIGGLGAIMIGAIVAVRSSTFFNNTEKNIITASFFLGPFLFGVLLIVYLQKKARIEASKKLNKGDGKISNDFSSLRELKDSGLIDESEYKSKFEKLKAEYLELSINKKLNQSKEYKSLVQLKNSGFLNDIEFESKISILRERISSELRVTDFESHSQSEAEDHKKDPVEHDLEVKQSTNDEQGLLYGIGVTGVIVVVYTLWVVLKDL